MPVIAAVDVGTNAIRLSVVRVEAWGESTPLDNERYALRLGADTYELGRIGPTAQKEIISIFSDIGRRMTRAGVERYRAVATAGLRDAANGKRVVGRIHKATSVVVEIIDGKEESRLVERALMQSLGTVPAQALLMDLGGGSLELILCGARRTRSLALGTVRLLQAFPFLAGNISRERLDEVRAFIRRALPAGKAWRLSKIIGVGTGGNLDALVRILPHSETALAAIDLTRLPKLVQSLSRLSASERGARFHLRHDRADLILPAALVLEAVADHFRAQAIVVPGTGLRQALLHDLATEIFVKRAHKPRTTHDARLLATAARSLFSALSPLHKLWPSAHPLLAAVAVRHLAAANGERRAPRRAQGASLPTAVAQIFDTVVAIARRMRSAGRAAQPRLEWLQRPFVLRVNLAPQERRWAERLLRRALSVRVVVR